MQFNFTHTNTCSERERERESERDEAKIVFANFEEEEEEEEEDEEGIHCQVDMEPLSDMMVRVLDTRWYSGEGAVWRRSGQGTSRPLVNSKILLLASA